MPRKATRHLFARLLSYLILLLLLAVVIITLLSGIAMSALTSEVEKITEMNVQQMQSNIDASIGMLQNVAATLAGKAEIQDVLDALAQNSNALPLKLQALQKMLRNNQINNRDISELYVFFNKSRFLVSSEYAFSASLSDKACQTHFGRSFDDAFQFLRDIATNSACLFENKERGSMKLAAMIPIYNVLTYRQCDAAVCVVLNENKFRDILSNYESASGTFMMIAKDTTAYSTAEYEGIESLVANQPDGIAEYKYNAEKLVIALRSSQGTNYRYAAIIPQGDYLQDLTRFRQITYLVLLACVVLGAVIIVLFGKHNVKPLQRLIGVLSDGGERHRNEFEYLEGALLELIQKKNHGEAVQEHYDAFRRQYLINMLCLGKVSDIDSFSETANRIGIGFTGSRFYVGQVRVLDSKRFARADNEDGEDLLTITVNTLVTHEAVQIVHVIPTSLDNRLIYIVCLPEEWEGEVTEAVNWQSVINTLNEQFGIQIQAALSHIYNGLDGVARAYLSSAGLFEYADMYGIHKSLMIKDKTSGDYTPEFDPVGTPSHIKAEKLIISCILSQDYEGASRLTLEVLDAMQSSASDSLIPLTHMLRTIILTLEDTRSLFPKEFYTALNVQNRLMNAATISEVRLAIVDIFGQLNSCARDSNRKMAKAAQKIMDFIEANYANPLLNRPYVADQLGLSVSYLSHILKEQNDSTVMSLLHAKRIEVAKGLLAQTDCSLQEIAEQVGYTNIYTFSRAFKEIEGTSPGKYRSTMKAAK